MRSDRRQHVARFPALTLSPGTRLGPYEIAAPIGAGGMGEVYLAHDTRLGRQVAVKVLPAEVADDAERLRRFDHEARAASALNHPNILTVHDLGNEAGTAFLVTELLAGESLRELMRKGPLTEKRALAITIDVAKGLSAAHGKGIVHRDLKPDNLFVTSEGAVKILDFGLARIERPAAPIDSTQVDSTQETTLLETVAGTVLGTPGYMAPEQVRGERADSRADLFALGCVFFEMLAGSSPFRRRSIVESLNAILNEPVPEFEAKARVQPAVSRIVERLLEKDPARRFHSAADLAFTLDAMRGIPSPAVGREARPSDNKAGSRWRLPAAVIGLFAAGLAVAVWSSLRPTATTFGAIRFEVSPPADGAFNANSAGHNFALSPDGRVLAYVAGIHGQNSIFLRDFSKIAPRALEGTAGAQSLFWSPDGAALAFFANGKLKRVMRDGGPVQVICQVQGSVTGSWGNLGTIVFSQFFGPDDGLFRVPAAGGAAVRIDSERGVRPWVHFLPDGRRFLFWGRRSDSIAGNLYVGDIEGGPATLLLEQSTRAEYAAPGWLLYIHSGALVARPFDADSARLSGEEIPLASNIPHFFNGWSMFSVAGSRALAYQVDPEPLPLLWFDRHGRETGRSGPPARYISVRLSPDGKSAAVTVADPDSTFTDVWIVDLARGGSTRLTDEPFLDWNPAWSPGSDRIIYTSVSPGPQSGPQFTVKVRRVVDGEKLTELPPHNTFIWAQAWTRFGIYLDVQEPKTGWDLMRLPALDAELEPILQTAFAEFGATPSPDGKWLAFLRNASDGSEIALVRAGAPSQPVRVAAAKSTIPRWRGDGRELFYVSADGWLSAISISGDDPPKLGEPEALFQVDLENANGFDVTPDGQRFLLAATRPASSLPITVVLDWQTNLEGESPK